MPLKVFFTFMFIGWSSASLACTYEPIVPTEDDGRTVFLGSCGFYETGYRLQGNKLYFPNGGVHIISEASDQEAQAILKDTYGLVEMEDGMYIRTKDVIQSPKLEG